MRLFGLTPFYDISIGFAPGAGTHSKQLLSEGRGRFGRGIVASIAV